ncbi:MAG: aminotransferase class I/II-fold pyridoxal phosphate-dependent enzyme [Desulfobacterales bacterium]|jgi:glycine C-acetyltransferase
MSVNRFEQKLMEKLTDLETKGTLKGREMIITSIKPPEGDKGPRYLLQGHGDQEFIRMNSNAYLGLSRHPALVQAEEDAARLYGTGPGAVRFISGTFIPHVQLEKRLADFHAREDAMIFSSAYATIMGALPALIDPETAVISDALNHNCIINAIRLARPKVKAVYDHLDMSDLEAKIKTAMDQARRVLIVTDGIFSMRGDYAPLDIIGDMAARYSPQFAQGVHTIVDDSHGVGAFGRTGRGTLEYTGAAGIDILVATLGKAFGVNGGYLVASAPVVSYLRETAPFYIYSNPITPAEAGAALTALEILDGPEGEKLLEHLRTLTQLFEQGLVDLGFEVLRSAHPIVPLMIRDTSKTREMVQYLTANGILATGLKYPVVPKGDEEIRFQISAEHTLDDLAYVLRCLEKFYKDK